MSVSTFPSFYKFSEAQAAKGPGDQVCGVILPDGTPVYYLVPVESDDMAVFEQAFTLRNKRAPTAIERTMMEIAKNPNRLVAVDDD